LLKEEHDYSGRNTQDRLKEEGSRPSLRGPSGRKGFRDSAGEGTGGRENLPSSQKIRSSTDYSTFFILKREGKKRLGTKQDRGEKG